MTACAWLGFRSSPPQELITNATDTMSTDRKTPSTKRTTWEVWRDETWIVRLGRLVPPPGRPRKTAPLFKHVAEKIPYGALNAVHDEFKERDWTTAGVYVAHDSMGFARYVGRGDVFARLKARRRAAKLELVYFSFYIVANKNHEREIETLLIRIGGAHLHFNSRKKRVDIAAGSVLDYEAGTRFVERRRVPKRVRRKS